ncbi:MAG: Maf family protein [Bacillota bacterium]|nr:Maf family protein [Bacillota bacterium]
MQTSDQDRQYPGCRLILASASPRRRELMERFWAGRLQVIVPQFDERIVVEGWNKSPEELAIRLTAGKIDALQAMPDLPTRYCALAADTLVVADTEILGKPVDAADAARHLRLLSGREHRVLTGLHVAFYQDGRTDCLQTVEETTVRFADLDESVINWYIRTGEPFDKAGSYGIQGAGAALVERIDGCYYNVMGLPVYRLLSLLREAADRFTSFAGLSDLLPWS